MDYTINQLARLAGVSTRTLRYYDQVGLLKPSRVSGNGYRIYDSQSVDRLQQILFYRELGLALDDIQQALGEKERNPLDILSVQRQLILARLEQTQRLLETLDRTIAAHRGGKNMSDQAKFEGLKRKQLEENERHYGEEIRAHHGEEVVRKANERYLNQDEATYSVEAHVGLGEMYVADERFTQYYDQHKEGAAKFLCDAIAYWAPLLP